MNLEVVPIKKNELSLLMLEEASKEGWSYSQDDVDFYYHCPQNYNFAIKVEGILAGGVILHRSLSRYQGRFLCSVGLFLVLNKYRGKKTVGPYLWHHAITKQLDSNSIVCFHAVPRTVDYYERLNFKKTPLVDLYQALTNESVNHSLLSSRRRIIDQGELKIIDKDKLNDIAHYTNQLFPNEIGLGLREFIGQWVSRPDALVVGYYQNGLQGYGVVTICNQKQVSKKMSYRISPLYANSVEIAQSILKHLVITTIKNDPNFKHIELNTMATTETRFGCFLNTIGFVERGKNIVVCNHPTLINSALPSLDTIFCSIPLEYPPEAIVSI